MRNFFSEDVIRFYEQLLQTFPAPLRWYHRGLKRPAMRRFFTFWEELLLPGDLMHIILRKWYLTRWLERLHGAGYRQLLILGSGFDHLAPLYSARGMKSLEIDTPRMIQIKKQCIDSCGYANTNLMLEKGFLSHDKLSEILNDTQLLDPCQKTVVIAEGFFDYFTQDECAVFLRDLRGFFKDETKLLSTVFSLHELSGFRSFIYKNSIRLAGEELKLGLSKHAFLSFLSEHGFEQEQCISHKKMRDEVLRPRGIDRPVLPGFYLVEAKTERKQ